MKPTLPTTTPAIQTLLAGSEGAVSEAGADESVGWVFEGDVLATPPLARAVTAEPDEVVGDEDDAGEE